MQSNNLIEQIKINIDWTCSAVGDTVCFLPILKVLCDRGLIESVLFNKKYDFLGDIVKLIVPHNRVITKIDNAKYKSKYRFVNSFTSYPSSIHMHLVDYASIAICDAILPAKDRTYPIIDTSFLDCSILNTLPDQYFAIQCGHTSKLKKMPQKAFDDILDFFIKNKIYLVLLGRNYDVDIDSTLSSKIRPDEYIKNINSPYIINMIDKTSIVESLIVMSKAKAMLGMDSGLIHLAGLTEVPIIVAYTHKHPEYLMPIRHNELGWNVFPIVPDDGVCRFCMTEYYNQYGYDYTNCAKGNTECCSNITADKFIEQIKKII